MNTANWKDIAELVGIAAIVASLIFVGLQMRQSHEIALVTLYQMRADAAREVMTASLESTALADAFERMDNGGEATYTDVYALDTYASILFNHFENSHFLYTRGFLTAEHWRSDLANIAGVIREPQVREFWESQKHIYRQSFVDTIEKELGQ